MNLNQSQIKLQLRQNPELLYQSLYHSEEFEQKMRVFRTHKIYQKQFIKFIADLIRMDSILTLKLLSEFFKQLNQTIKRYTQKQQQRKNLRINLGLLYITVIHKLSIMKYYYGQTYIRSSLQHYFQDSISFTKLYQRWLEKCELKVQFLNSSIQNKSQQNYLTQKDKLIIYYIKAKLEKTSEIICICRQEHLQIMDFIAKYKPFYPQHEYKQYLQDVLRMHGKNSSYQKTAQDQTQKIINNNINPGMTQCVTCAQFFYINFDLKGTKSNLCDIVPIERIQQLKSSLKKNSLKTQILALINSDVPSVMLFGCEIQGLNIIIKGEYITQYQKDIYQQKFIELTKSIKPIITINEDFRIQFVPLIQNPFKYQNPTFLKSVYVMRVKFHLKKPWFLHYCEIDKVNYFYIRRKSQDVQLKGQQFYLQLRRRYMKYSPTYPIKKQLQKAQQQQDDEKTIQILSLISGKRYIPTCFHQESGPCTKPGIGQVVFTSQQERTHIFYPQKSNKN